MSTSDGLLAIIMQENVDFCVECGSKPHNQNCYIQGGQAKVSLPTYIFDGNIWMHR